MKFAIKDLPENCKSFKVLNWKKIKSIKSTPFKSLNNDYDKIVNLGWRMVQTCVGDKGIGLAAAQVGVFKKAILVQDLERESETLGFLPQYTLMLNPSFEPIDKTKESDIEYCLSVPNKGFEIKRYKNILLTYSKVLENGSLEEIKYEKSGFEARIMQHEIDHTNGVSIPQRWEYQNK